MENLLLIQRCTRTFQHIFFTYQQLYFSEYWINIEIWLINGNSTHFQHWNNAMCTFVGNHKITIQIRYDSATDRQQNVCYHVMLSIYIGDEHSITIEGYFCNMTWIFRCKWSNPASLIHMTTSSLNKQDVTLMYDRDQVWRI